MFSKFKSLFFISTISLVIFYRYFIYRDTHFNAAGLKLIADNFLENYNNILNNLK